MSIKNGRNDRVAERSGNGDTTKQFALRVGIVVVAILVLAIAFALFTGMIVIPPEIQTTIWNTVLSLLIIASTTVTGFVGYINARNAARTREQEARNAEIIRANSDRNALETQSKVQELITDVHNGLKGDFAKEAAALVDENARRLADVLEKSNLLRDAERRAQQIESDARSRADALLAAAEAKAATVTLGAKIDAVGGQAAPAAVQAVEPSLPTAHTEHAEAVAADTKALDDHTSVLKDLLGGTP